MKPSTDLRTGRSAPVACLLAGCVGLLFASPPLAQDAAGDTPSFQRLESIAPEDGTVSRERPVFRIGFQVADMDEARRMRFRIVLRSRERGVEPYVFDQREQRSGWSPGGDSAIVFRPPRPLADGLYDWEAFAWNGFEWNSAGETRELTLDTVPPADVDELTLTFRHDDTGLRIDWAPVTLDRDGRPEYVVRYHVYRFEVSPNRPIARPFEIAVVETPEYIDRQPPAAAAILFYRVAAEDAAGNVPDLRR